MDEAHEWAFTPSQDEAGNPDRRGHVTAESAKRPTEAKSWDGLMPGVREAQPLQPAAPIRMA